MVLSTSDVLLLIICRRRRRRLAWTKARMTAVVGREGNGGVVVGEGDGGGGRWRRRRYLAQARVIAAMAGEGEWEGKKDGHVDPTAASPSTRLDPPAAAIEGVDPAHPALPRKIPPPLRTPCALIQKRRQQDGWIRCPIPLWCRSRQQYGGGQLGLGFRARVLFFGIFWWLFIFVWRRLKRPHVKF